MPATQSAYARQIQLADVGIQGQERLSKAHVGVVGAGGLGCPVITYLAAAGVGQLSIWDCDSVSLSNTNRQFLYAPQHVGQSKAQLMRLHMAQYYPHISCHIQDEKVTERVLQQVTRPFDCLILCVDNMATRLEVNAYAMAHDIPLVDAGVDGFYGYVHVRKSRQSACTACLQSSFHAESDTAIAALGAVCGVIGSLQATVCLQVLWGKGEDYEDVLLQFDAKCGELEKIPLMPHPACPWHKNM